MSRDIWMINRMLADDDWEPRIGDIVTNHQGVRYTVLEKGIEVQPMALDLEGWFGDPH